MLAWWSQKIGSRAAHAGSLIQPLPPTATWTTLWGWNSSSPVPLPKCTGCAVKLPPKVSSENVLAVHPAAQLAVRQPQNVVC